MLSVSLAMVLRHDTRRRGRFKSKHVGGRVVAAGDLVRAEEAREKASDWAYTFASFATSGGEGAAFSYERNQFLATLK